MSESKNCEPLTQSPPEPLSSGEMPEQSGKEVIVHYRPEPAKPKSVREIHPRQKIPPVPEGEEVPDDTPSPPVELD